MAAGSVQDAAQAQQRSHAPLRLRRAGMADAARLAALAGPDAHRDEGGRSVLEDCLEFGGALWFEDRSVPVSLLCWREVQGGWELRPVRVAEGYDELSHSRWLMTQVEALAIRMNVPELALTLSRPADLDLYRRMGYEPAGHSGERLVRRVGGTWQLRSGHA